ncbi:MAG: hypothetical protein H7Y07_02215 [Pyrinomonadaceae bacterium]|nr:hypothetical protein [Sphingobacteriaceae bacterium]
METKEHPMKASFEFNRGYEKGYHTKDYTWEDGIGHVLIDPSSNLDDYKRGYIKGQNDRVRDELENWLL